MGTVARPVNLVIWKCYQTSKSSFHACSYIQSLWEEQMGLATNQKKVGDLSGSMTPTLERLTCWETCPFIGTAQPVTQVGFVGSRHLGVLSGRTMEYCAKMNG